MRRSLSKFRWRIKTYRAAFFQWAEDTELSLLSSKFEKVQTSVAKRLPPHGYEFLDEYFQRFLNSKSHQGVNPNQQLALVCGPENIGKTELIRKNLKAYVDRLPQFAVALRNGESPYVESPYTDVHTNRENSMRASESMHFLKVQLDLQANSELTFQAFLHIFEKELVRSMLAGINSIEKTGNEVLTVDILISLLLNGKSPEYVLMYLKDYLAMVVNDCAVNLVSEDTKTQLTALLSETTSIMVPIQRVREIIQKVITIVRDPQQTEVEAAIRLCMGICTQIEYEYRPKQFTSGWYRSGIDTTDFLLDILNFLGGLHPICLAQVQRRYNDPQSLPSSNYILSGNHIDCVVALLNVNCLSCLRHSDFLEWFDHLILRVHNPSLMRTHVPVILELGPIDRAKDILSLGKLGFDSPTVIEVYGYRVSRLTQSNLSSLFTPRQLKWLWPVCGTHPIVWKKAIEKLAKEQVKWPELKNTNWCGDAKRSVVLRSKINQIFASDRTRHYLDEGNLRWRVAQQLQHLIRCRGLLVREQEHVDHQVVNDPVQMVMIDQQLTSCSYYFDIHHLVYHSDLWQLSTIRNSLINRGIIDTLKYRWWKLATNPISRQKMRFQTRMTISAENTYELYPQRRFNYPVQEYFVKKENYREVVFDINDSSMH